MKKMKKEVCILAPDTVPLPIRKDYLPSLSKEERQDFLGKYCNATAYGVRSWKFAEELSKNFDVTLLVPDIYLPESDILDTSNLKFKIDSYNYRISSWNWSQELDRKLKKTHFVIIQTHSGSGLQNCAVLPSNVNLIVDGWSVLPLELSGQLLTHSKISRKVFWQRAMMQYKEVITRANCLLVANERQVHFYEGFFYGVEKHNFNSFQFSPVLKVPFGVEEKNVTRTPSKDSDLKVVWLGPIHSWDCAELLIRELVNYDKITINFINIKHPRQPKVYNTYFRSYFEKIDEISNMCVEDIEDTSTTNIYSKYDFGISLTRNWILGSYIHKTSALDFLSYKLPVITNNEDCLYEEFDFLRPSLYPIELMDIKSQLDRLVEKKNEFTMSDDAYVKLTGILSWTNTLLPLVDYMNNF